ncbi:MAG: CCA tRNA nucleotidyltransferase [Methanocorpusculum sp.]|nr:CCA tRNA nucleotidyltransferase [Methanocorpusculum sp.]
MRNRYEEDVLREIFPSKEEEQAVEEMGEKLIAAVASVAGIPAMVTGSVARGTWVKGDKDIDLFMLFPPETEREELRERGLAAGYAVVEMFGGTAGEKYAEHPYLNAVINGFDVDLVPCYQINSTSEMKCAVDRTPFHTRYLKEKITPLRADVLLLKQFCKAGGVYGSDHTTGGLSGYLCELLTLFYGGFTEVLSAAAGFRPQTIIDIEQYYPDKKAVSKLFSEPLIVVDPTDKTRNVAAAVTMTKLAEFTALARGYLTRPSKAYFTAEPQVFFSKEDFTLAVSRRKTAFVSLTFKTPEFVEDTVVPQLKKTEESIAVLLKDAEFSVIRSGFSMGKENSLLLFELQSDTISSFTIREGPPVWNVENSERFTAKYADCGGFAGPWISRGRWYAETARKYTEASALLGDTNALFSAALGKHIRLSLEGGFAVKTGLSVWDEEFSAFFAGYFTKTASSIRKMQATEGDSGDLDAVCDTNACR